MNLSFILTRKGLWFLVAGLPFVWESAKQFLLQHASLQTFIAWWFIISGGMYAVVVASRFSKMNIGEGLPISTWLIAAIQIGLGIAYLRSAFTTSYAQILGWSTIALGIYFLTRKGDVAFFTARPT